MDSSGIFVKMCEKAEEIQGQWEPKSYDYVYDTDPHEYNEVSLITNPAGFNKNGFIWLPRQDQLQEMLQKYVEKDCLVGDSISKRMAMYFGIWVQKEECLNFYSMEQYWLVWLMKEKFNKVWDGDNWING